MENSSEKSDSPSQSYRQFDERLQRYLMVMLEAFQRPEAHAGFATQLSLGELLLFATHANALSEHLSDIVRSFLVKQGNHSSYISLNLSILQF